MIMGSGTSPPTQGMANDASSRFLRDGTPKGSGRSSRSVLFGELFFFTASAVGRPDVDEPPERRLRLHTYALTQALAPRLEGDVRQGCR